MKKKNNGQIFKGRPCSTYNISKHFISKNLIWPDNFKRTFDKFLVTIAYFLMLMQRIERLVNY